MRSSRSWSLVAGLIALPTLLPLAAVLWAFVDLEPELWSHLAQYVLPQVIPNTLWLLAAVGVGVSVLGSALAALVSLCEFPGRRAFAWLLLLPLAIPSYVLATVFLGAFDFGGSIAVALRGAGFALPEVRNLGGLAAVMVLSLYPYVFLVTRSAFATQGARQLEAARSLGHGPARAFFRVVLPLAAPWVAAGTALALMETLADFGTVAAFNYDTFTVAIYKAWFGLFSIGSALQLAGVLLVFVAALLTLESWVRRRRVVAQTGQAATRLPLRGMRAVGATLFCACVLLLGFVLPALQLGTWAWAQAGAELDRAYAERASNSVSLGMIAAGLTATAALLLAYAQRHDARWFTRAAARTATLGYAFPGPLLALGLFVPLAGAIQLLNQALGLALIIHGSLVVMLMAYGVRFLAVAQAPVAAGLLRVRPSIDESVQLLGITGLARLRRVHLPLLRPGLLAATALVFVDVMKEMPITLMTRPFGWDTLAVRIFELTSEGEWQRAALPALGIVTAGLIPIWWLTRSFEHAPRA